MRIDIDKLTEEELRDLNRRIVERLKLMQQMRAHKRMMEFSVGERVAFHLDGRPVEGIIAKYNRKTVTVVADNGQSWNVWPGFLDKVRNDNRDNVIEIAAAQGQKESS